MTAADTVSGILIKLFGGGYAFRVYHDKKKERFTDYELRHDDLSVTIDSDALASFYSAGENHVLDHSPNVLGLKEI
ncbi:hypothetical protein MNBD_GAMMA12-1752 [hydrothermal vent metagenome]|uniref:Uncharacterized protein n=1 Tax=hydrothermal vent metagenome TaxID=652676 RepID=A0A3B0YV75_9ZZZZ